MITTSASESHQTPAPSRGEAATGPLWEGGVGLLAVVLGAVVIVDAAGIRAPAGVQVIGPRVFPVAVGCLLLALGLGLAIQGVRHRVRHRPHHAAPVLAEALLPDVVDEIAADAAPVAPEVGRSLWQRTLLLLAALVAYAVLLRPVGFVLVSTALFAAAITAFGGRPVRGLLVGAVLSVVVYIAFTQGLELQLPGLPGIG